MMKKWLMIMLVFAMSLTFSAAPLLAQENNSPGQPQPQKKSPPFLITQNLPHLTKILMQQWDSPVLNLSGEQKANLLVVRKETIAGVKRVSKEIAPLEQQVVAGAFARKAPEELQSVVRDISRLKVEATMIHLRCIYDTSEILDQRQLDILLN